MCMCIYMYIHLYVYICIFTYIYIRNHINTHTYIQTHTISQRAYQHEQVVISKISRDLHTNVKGWRRPIGCLIFISHFPQRALLIVALLRKMTCILRIPMGLYHPVMCIYTCTGLYAYEIMCIYMYI